MKKILDFACRFVKRVFKLENLAIFIGFTAIVANIALAKKEVLNFLANNADIIFTFFLSFAVIFSFLVFIIRYLNKGVGAKNKSDLKSLNEVIKANKAAKLDLERRIAALGTDSLTDKRLYLTGDERAEFIESAKKRIVGNTIRLAEDSLKQDIQKYKKNNEISKMQADMITRLENEIERLNRRGGVNLGIGSTIAVFGIVVLAVFLYKSQDLVIGLNFVISLLPKLSFVLVVELFAYFFLRLYKNGYEEIKYFQNEITNIGMKVMALRYALEYKSEDTVKELSLQLIKTERNFVLNKGQTTVFLEKDKIKGEADSKIMSLLTDLIKLKQK